MQQWHVMEVEGGLKNPLAPILHGLGSLQLSSHCARSWQWPYPTPLSSGPIWGLKSLELGPSGWGRGNTRQNRPFSG